MKYTLTLFKLFLVVFIVFFLRKGKETVLLNLGKTDKNICKHLGKTDKV